MPGQRSAGAGEPEIVLEGVIHADETALEGPSAITPAITTSRNASRCSPSSASPCGATHLPQHYTGKPPDEPAVLGMALNEVFVPLLQKQFPEITDFYLPRRLLYRLAVVSMKKAVSGPRQARDVSASGASCAVMYTKFIIVTDDDVDIRDWKEVIWALTRARSGARHAAGGAHAHRLSRLRQPGSGLGSKMGIDATNKWPGETSRAGASRSPWMQR